MAARVGSQIQQLTDKLKKLEMVATDAKMAAAGASTPSTMAFNVADKLVKSFEQLRICPSRCDGPPLQVMPWW